MDRYFRIVLAGAIFGAGLAATAAAQEEAPAEALIIRTASTQSETLGAGPTVSPAQALIQPQDPPATPAFSTAEIDRPEKWNIYGGTVFLHRSAPAPGPLVTTFFLPGSPTILDASQVNIGWMFGFEAGAAYNFTDRWGIDIRYLQVQPWNATFGPVTVPTSNVANQGILSFAPFPNAVSAQYQSTLRSGEINGRYTPGGWLTALAGFRYVNLDDIVLLTQTGVGVPATAKNLDLTSNHMFGGQIGLEALLINSGRFTVDAYAKAGIYGTYVRTFDVFAVDLGGVPAPGTPFVRSASRGQVSFLGDGGLNATYRINSWAALEGGYQLMWLTGAALAADQFRAGPGPFTAPLAVNTTGFAFFQGFTLALKFSH
jgi:hypothetical protein